MCTYIKKHVCLLLPVMWFINAIYEVFIKLCSASLGRVRSVYLPLGNGVIPGSPVSFAGPFLYQKILLHVNICSKEGGTCNLLL